MSGALVTAAEALEALARALRELDTQPPAPVPPAVPVPEPTWRERLWTCPPATRLGVRELCEALGRPKSWVYRHTSAHSGGPRLPCRRLGGELTFIVAEIRVWVHENEVTVMPGRVMPLAVARRPKGAA